MFQSASQLGRGVLGVSTEYGANRWWENYLVRYLMPSIAGVAIVSWLCSQGGDGFRALLFLPPIGMPLDATSLTLLFLYGNLFCYIASYPVLVFHATRVMDFTGATRWRMEISRDGYLTTLLLSAAVLVLFRRGSGVAILDGFRVGYLASSLATTSPAPRAFSTHCRRRHCRTCDPAFGYVYALSRRRGIPERLVRSPASTIETIGGSEWRDEWRRDFISTYRHLREHGNSAFIFLFEIALAGLVCCVIKKPGLTPSEQMSAVGVLLFVWAVPSVLVHLLGQHLERRFAQFDMKVDGAAPPPPPPTVEERRRDV